MNLQTNISLFRCKPIVAWLCSFLLAGNMLAQNPDTILLGSISRNDLENSCPWFAERYAQYQPSKKVVQKIKPYTSNIQFVLVIGTWCSDSREHVPAFFKVSDQLGIQPEAIRIIGVNRKKDRLPSSELDALNIDFVPTIIVYRNGIEKGRIVEDTHKNMESDLWQILKK